MDDEPAVAAAHARVLGSIDVEVSVVGDASRALAALEEDAYDLVVSDVAMPGVSGTALLRKVRERDLDLPVIFLTGAPTLESAADAVELHAFRYLTKPVRPQVLRDAVTEAVRMRSLARTSSGAIDRPRLERTFFRALQSLTMVYQPIVAVETRQAIGFEALMRSSEPGLPGPLQVLDAAEKLSAVHVLGRRVRGMVAAQLEASSGSFDVFVNLHPTDLVDPELSDPSSPLSRFARRVVLELTERASLEGLTDVGQRLAQLRSLGYRLAVDDLGAGYAGLSYFARVQPEIVKIDMSLVRGIDTDPVKQRVVQSLISLAVGLGMEIVGEGVETPAERDALVRLGCTHLQGYALGRPGAPFPTPTWS